MTAEIDDKIVKYLREQTEYIGGVYDVGDGKSARTAKWAPKTTEEIVAHIGEEHRQDILVALDGLTKCGSILTDAIPPLGRKQEDSEKGPYSYYDYYSGLERSRTFLEYIKPDAPPPETEQAAPYLNPDWNEEDRVHNWRNYISVEVQAMWDTFSAVQKAALYKQADEQASREEWD